MELFMAVIPLFADSCLRFLYLPVPAVFAVLVFLPIFSQSQISVSWLDTSIENLSYPWFTLISSKWLVILSWLRLKVKFYCQYFFLVCYLFILLFQTNLPSRRRFSNFSIFSRSICSFFFVSFKSICRFSTKLFKIKNTFYSYSTTFRAFASHDCERGQNSYPMQSKFCSFTPFSSKVFKLLSISFSKDTFSCSSSAIYCLDDSCVVCKASIHQQIRTTTVPDQFIRIDEKSITVP